MEKLNNEISRFEKSAYSFMEELKNLPTDIHLLDKSGHGCFEFLAFEPFSSASAGDDRRAAKPPCQPHFVLESEWTELVLRDTAE